MEPYRTDLFGQVIVTISDVRAWLAAVPRIDPDGPRAEHYARAWHVVDKITRAKLAGHFDALTAPRAAAPAHWWLRFRWH
ncbi:MAG: hypothetical protein NDJ19_00700 [Ramlibacter sp.]|nr:hypothetical protein [Ramlibacter sp.]